MPCRYSRFNSRFSDNEKTENNRSEGSGSGNRFMFPCSRNIRSPGTRSDTGFLFISGSGAVRNYNLSHCPFLYFFSLQDFAVNHEHGSRDGHTRDGMQLLILAHREAGDNPNVNQLIPLPSELLDFLCIHPLRDRSRRGTRYIRF